MNVQKIKKITQSSFNEQQQKSLIQLFQSFLNEKKPPYLLWFIIGFNLILVVFLLLFMLQPSLPSHYIQIGTRPVISVREIIPQDLELIPKGSQLGAGEVDEFVIELIPSYEQPVSITATIDASTIAIGETNNPYNHLLITQLYELNAPEDMEDYLSIQTTLNFDSELKVYAKLIYLKIFLNSPSEAEYQEAYDAIAGKNISFSIGFRVI